MPSVSVNLYSRARPQELKTRPFFHCLRIAGKRDNGAADITGRFRLHEILRGIVLIVGVFAGIRALADLFPIGFRGFVVVEDRFGTQKAGSERDRNDFAFAKFARHAEGQTNDRRFDKIIKNVAAVVERVAVGDFEDDGLTLPEHERRGVMGSDNVGMESLLEHKQAVVQIAFVEGLAEFGERIAAPDVVDQDIEAFVTLFDSCD